MRGIDRWIHDLNKNDLAHLGEALEIAENDGQKALEQAREEHAAAVASALLRQKTELEGTAQQQQQQQVANTQRATEQQVQQELAQQFQQQLQQKEQQFQQQLQQQEQGLMRRISELEASSASAAAAQERHMESLQAENHQLLEKVASFAKAQGRLPKAQLPAASCGTPAAPNAAQDIEPGGSAWGYEKQGHLRP